MSNNTNNTNNTNNCNIDNENSIDKKKKLQLIAIIVAVILFFLSIFLWKYYNDNKQVDTKAEESNINYVINKIYVDKYGNVIVKMEFKTKEKKDSEKKDQGNKISEDKKEEANVKIKKAMDDYQGTRIENKIIIKKSEKCEELQD